MSDATLIDLIGDIRDAIFYLYQSRAVYPAKPDDYQPERPDPLGARNPRLPVYTPR